MFTWSVIATALRSFAFIAMLFCVGFGSVDAAACATEGVVVAGVDAGNGASVLNVDQGARAAKPPADDGDTNKTNKQPGMCAHGHCHSASAGLQATMTSEPLFASPADHGFRYEHPSHDDVLISLKRPPRA